MRIGIVTNEIPITGARWGGASSWVSHMVRSFKSIKEEPVVLFRWNIKDEENSDGIFDRNNLNNMECESHIIDNDIQIKNICDKLDGIIFSSHIEPNLMKRFKVLSSCPIILVLHTLEACEVLSRNADPKNIGNLIGSYWQEIHISIADAVVVISESDLDYYERLYYRTLNNNVELIRNPFHFKPPELNLSKYNNNTIGFIGRFCDRKRVKLIPRAVFDFTNMDLNLIMMGQTIKDEYFDKWKNCKILPLSFKEEDKRKFFDSIGIGIVTHNYEPSGYTAQELASNMIPIISAREGGVMEAFDNDDSSVMFYDVPRNENEEIRNMGKAIIKMINTDSKTRLNMSINAYNKLNKYDYRLCASNYCKIGRAHV